jgi:hypothetical protein
LLSSGAVGLAALPSRRVDGIYLTSEHSIPRWRFIFSSRCFIRDAVALQRPRKITSPWWCHASALARVLVLIPIFNLTELSLSSGRSY